MCYHGHQGFLTNIGSTSENVFIQGLIQSMPDYVASDDAWIGGIDSAEEGDFQWVGPGKLDQGVSFYDSSSGNAIDNAFLNWAEGEPNSGGQSGISEGTACLVRAVL